VKFFLAVIFFCNGEQCFFWKSSELFYKQEECLKVLKEASQALYQKGFENEGSCLQISTNKNIKW
jgi:hypothetical protein